MLPSLEGSNKEDSLLCLLDKRQWLKLLEEEPEQQWLLGISFMEHLKVLLPLVNNQHVLHRLDNILHLVLTRLKLEVYQLVLALELVEHHNLQMNRIDNLWIGL
jgi:hypothetical protein